MGFQQAFMQGGAARILNFYVRYTINVKIVAHCWPPEHGDKGGVLQQGHGGDSPPDGEQRGQPRARQQRPGQRAQGQRGGDQPVGEQGSGYQGHHHTPHTCHQQQHHHHLH